MSFDPRFYVSKADFKSDARMKFLSRHNPRINVHALKVSLILLTFIYFLIPTEASDPTNALLIRCVAALFLFFYISRGIPRHNKRLVIYFFILYAFVLDALIISYSLRFFILTISIALSYSWSVSLYYSTGSSKLTIDALKLLLYLSIVALLVQSLLYQFGYFLNIHEFLFPWSSVRVEDHLTFARLGGLYIEPGTYANWVYAIFILLVFVYRKVPFVLGLLVGISIILSLSVWGVMVGLIVLTISILASKGVKIYGRIAASLLIIIFLSVFISSDVSNYISTKLSLETPSGQSKTVAYEEFSSTWQELILLGKGFDPNFCDGCLAPEDAGVGMNEIVVFGSVFALLLFAPIYFYAYKLGGPLYLVLLGPLAFTKLFYWDFLMFLIISTAICGILKLRANNSTQSSEEKRLELEQNILCKPL